MPHVLSQLSQLEVNFTRWFVKTVVQLPTCSSRVEGRYLFSPLFCGLPCSTLLPSHFMNFDSVMKQSHGLLRYLLILILSIAFLRGSVAEANDRAKKKRKKNKQYSKRNRYLFSSVLREGQIKCERRRGRGRIKPVSASSHPVTSARRRQCFIWWVHQAKLSRACGQGRAKSRWVLQLKDVNEVAQTSQCIPNINKSHFGIGTCGNCIPVLLEQCLMEKTLISAVERAKGKKCF